MDQMPDLLTASERDELNRLRERVAALEQWRALHEVEISRLRQFAQAVELNANTIVITDVDGNIEYVNRKFTELTGYTPEEAIGKNPRLLQSGLTPRETYPDLWNTVLAGQTWRGEFTNRKKNGELYYENATIIPITGDDGQITHFVAVKEDITQRKLAEDALRSSQEEAQEFQERLKALHQVHATLAQIRDMTELFRQAVVLGRALLGFDRMGLLLASEDGEEFMGTFGTDAQGRLRDERHFRQRISRDSHLRAASQNLSHATIWDRKTLQDMGQVVGLGWGIVAPIWDEGRAWGWLAVDNLISQAPMKAYQPELLTLYGVTLGHLIRQLRVEQALRESNAYTQAMLQAIPDMIVRIKTDGTYLDIKPSPNVGTPIPPEQAIGRNVRDVLPPAHAQETIERLQRAITTGTIQTAEYSMVIDGQERWFESRIVALTPIEALGVVRDITDQRKALEHSVDLAMQQERMRLLANFITNASHEFRTPLSVIGVNVYLAEKSTDPARRAEALRAIQDQTQNLNALVEGLLTVMRLDWSGSLAENPVQLMHMLYDLARKTSDKAQELGLTVVRELAPELPLVLGNITRLTHALDRLLENALRFTPAGGRITLRSAHVGDNVVIEVEDTGIGMDSEQLRYIFEQFYRGDPSQTTRGLGLGLPIAQRIIHLHGGRIEVESELGKGSLFRVILPVYHPPDEPSSTSAPSTDASEG